MMPSRVYPSWRQVCLFDCRSLAFLAPESDMGTNRLSKFGGGNEQGDEPGPVLSALQVLLEERPVAPLELPVLPGAEGHVGDPEDLVPVGREGHLEHSVSEEELGGELGVELVHGALGEDFSNHPGGELDLVHGPVVLGVDVATRHGVEALVRPLHHALDDAGAGAVLAGRHVPGEFGHIHSFAVALDRPI